MALDAQTLWADRCLAHRDRRGNLSAKRLLYPFPWEGGKKSCQQSWPKNKANQAWISGESNNPRAANKVKQNLTAGRGWVAAEGTGAAEPAWGAHLVFSFPKPNLPNLLASPWGSSLDVCQRTHTHRAPCRQQEGVLSSAQECVPFSRTCCNSLPCMVS